MTRSQLRKNIWYVIALYISTIALGGVLKFSFPEKDDPVYSTFKDMIPFLVAIPAAYIVYCFNRRNSHVQALRSVWFNLVQSIWATRDYLGDDMPSAEKKRESLKRLSISIDEVRGVFRNIGESRDSIGLYPFEALKEIHDAVREVAHEDESIRQQARHAEVLVEEKWKTLRAHFLQEFERDEPDHPESRYFMPFGARYPRK